MYFNINIIFIIFSCQCLKIYTLKFGTENSQSGISSKSGQPDCVVSVPKDGNNMPIPLVTSSTGGPTVIYPDENGKFIIRHESQLNMSCAGSKLTSPPRVGLENLAVTCSKGSLVYGGKNYEFDQFKCSRNPKPTISITKNMCQRMTDRIIEVGYKTGFGFIILYRICFDTVFKSTLYTWHVVNPPFHDYRQKSVFEPTFISPHLKYKNVQEEYQKLTNALADILRSKKVANFYIKEDKKKRHYLVPDHLIPKNDFVYSFQQNATYFYENTVPQWLSFSEDIWTEVEKLVMRNVAGYNATRKIVSGTFLTSTFPNSSGVQQPFFLLTPQRMPVPLHRWTLDYDVASESGFVYVAMCDPYVTAANETEPICETMPCPGAKHLSAAARKLVYCCTKDSFEYAHWFDPDVFKIY